MTQQNKQAAEAQKPKRGRPRGSGASGTRAQKAAGEAAEKQAKAPAMAGQENAPGAAPAGKGQGKAATQKRAPRQSKPRQPAAKADAANAATTGAKQPAAQKGGQGQQNQRGRAAQGSAGAQGQGQQNAGRKPIHGTTRRRPKAKAPQLKMYPLGGLGEIGKNMTIFECEGDMIIVDCGSLFPDSDMYGVDLVIPDFTFVEQNRDRIRGIFITHGHEDHIGALPYLLRDLSIPLFATRLTLGLIQNKLDEHGLRGSTQTNLLVPHEKVKAGCFTVDPIHMNHSIPDAVAFAIACPAGVIIHTGDFKIDYTPIGGGVADLATLSDYGKKGVLALLSDSTNSERPGMSVSESKVMDNMSVLFARAEKKRLIVASFASNLYRVQQIVDLAIKHKRKVAISGRSMVNNTGMARELGYLNAPDNVFIEIEQINKYPPESVVLITTGSQGEPLSALSRMAASSHRQVRVGPNDCIIISATPIPGNEKMVTKTVNGLMRLGADVIYERMYEVHASGHACQDEQKLVIDLVRPKYFIPVHGEYKHLHRHAATAQAMGIPKKNILIADTGDTILISEDGLGIGEAVQAGAVMVDGLGVGDVGSVVLRDRRLLSQDGIVILSAAVDGNSGHLVSSVELHSRGFVYVKESEQLLEETRAAVQRVLEKYASEPHRDINSLKTRVRETASSLLYRRTKRSPMILPMVQEV